MKLQVAVTSLVVLLLSTATIANQEKSQLFDQNGNLVVNEKTTATVVQSTYNKEGKLTQEELSDGTIVYYDPTGKNKPNRINLKSSSK